uniref:MARVEL domain-containing protein n=1 Tax=Globodera pallida TaxID=36090 RepID=A0A183CGR2_GLOPA
MRSKEKQQPILAPINAIAQAEVPTSSATIEDYAAPLEAKDEPPAPYQFDPNEDFYLAPPTCQFLHYRDAAVLVGIVEVLLLICALYTAMNYYIGNHLVGVWAPLLIASVLCIAICTTVAMVYGIRHEQPQLLWPQIYFLKVEITMLMAGAVFSIACMCLGIESTNWIFSHFVSVPLMELNFGPIWPFNLAIASFSGAALGIWFDVIVRGCLDYLLDKEYFAQGPQPIQIGECFGTDGSREERRMEQQ